ncbi:MAG: Fic family protein, partial [Gemmatimonadales bacterium]|nr:Fic family protein [Gemmatimonadales bacterium]
MATQAEKLAQSLEVLTELRDEGRTAIRSRNLTRTHRERLLAAGFLQEVMKGWYIPSLPDQAEGESTAWYVSYWGFCADYLGMRFGDDWYLSPEQSLLLHAGNNTIPKQLLVRSKKGDNNPVSLPHETSLLTVRTSISDSAALEVKDGIRIYSLAAALIAVAPDFFARHEVDAYAALAQISNASEVLPVLLDQGRTTIAGRLAGAFEKMGRTRIADDIVQAMRAAGYEIRKRDPFLNLRANPPIIPLPVDSAPPHVHRLQLLWSKMREPVISCFPQAPAAPVDVTAYLKSVEETYTTDAYHSLSIEGYQVSKELIERVRSGRWTPDAHPDGNEQDRSHRNALAAKGYWQAFQQVQKSLERVLGGENPGIVVDEDHGSWYREMFAPGVAAGLIRPSDLAGYRNGPVFISRSRHVPPRSVVVRDLMPAFFELLRTEEDPAARVLLGHFVFVFIHPYLDGNGRIGRFLMNVMLASGGYPWVVIPVEQRDTYMTS